MLEDAPMPAGARFEVQAVMKLRAWLACGIGLMVMADAGLALGRDKDKDKRGSSEAAKDAREKFKEERKEDKAERKEDKEERKEERKEDKAEARYAWNWPGLGRPIKNLDDLTQTRAARREAHRKEVRDRLKVTLAYPGVLRELERHARFEARIDVLEAKTREANKMELLARVGELRRKEDERHAKNLEQLSKGGAK